MDANSESLTQETAKTVLAIAPNPHAIPGIVGWGHVSDAQDLRQGNLEPALLKHTGGSVDGEIDYLKVARLFTKTFCL